MFYRAIYTNEMVYSMFWKHIDMETGKLFRSCDYIS